MRRNTPEIEKINSFIKAHAKKCAYCGRPFHLGQGKTIDHINPKAFGGDESIQNKVVCCFKCNQKKGQISLKEFRKKVRIRQLERYLKDFGDIQAPTGEHYARAIRKRFGL